MALDHKVGSFNTGTGTGTLAITGVGFVPKMLLLWWNGRTGTGDASGGASEQHGIGWATGTSNEAVCYTQAQDAQATTNTSRGHRTDACVAVMTVGGTTEDGRLSLASFDADGFTFDIDNQFASDYRVHYIALGGSDITNAVTGSFQEQAATGPYSVTGLGFQPDVVLFLSIGVGTAAPTTTAYNALVLGAATSASNQALLAIASRHADSTARTGTYCRAGEIWANISGEASSPTARATFVSMDVGGFTVDFTERSSTRYIFYLAIKGGQWHVGDIVTATDTSNFAETGVGFQPDALLFASHCATATTVDSHTNQGRWSLGAATSATERVAMATLDEEGTANSETATAVEHDEVYINFALDDTVQGLMDLVSMDSDGFTVVMDDADPTAAFVWYLAVGAEPAAGGGGNRRRRVLLMGS